MLAEKDLLWTPARGKYITFAGVVIEHELHAIRDRARTVHPPRNSSCRMKQYRKEEGEGTIRSERPRPSPISAARVDGTKAVGDGASTASASLAHEPLSGSLGPSPPPPTWTPSSSSDPPASAPFEALVVGRLCGLGVVRRHPSGSSPGKPDVIRPRSEGPTTEPSSRSAST